MRPMLSCDWAIQNRAGFLDQCRAPVTHYDPEPGCLAHYCREHASEFMEVFGEGSLIEFAAEEPKTTAETP